MFLWPMEETLLAWQGGTSTSGGNTLYTFPSKYDPCSGSVSCTNFPAVGYPGGMYSLAVDDSQNPPKGTLWAVTVASGNDAPTTHYQGTLYSYTLNVSSNSSPPPTNTVTATKLFSGFAAGPSAVCSTATNPVFPLQEWDVSPYAEPTIANGNVFVPSYRVVPSTSYQSSSGYTYVSGILVFGSC